MVKTKNRRPHKYQKKKNLINGMSSATKDTVNFITITFVRVVLGVCGTLITILVLEMRSDIKELGKDTTAIRERLSAVEAVVNLKK